MKKILLLSAVVCMAFYACKKDSKPEGPEEPVKEIDPANRAELSSSIKVGYGSIVKAELPAASGIAGAPEIEGMNDNGLSVISGRYIVIRTWLVSGTIAGYYLQINGAGEYFNIDYTKERNLRKSTRHRSSLRETDFRDSVIVIKLPEHLKSDTFSITYAAYDTLNQVSNHLSNVVSVLPASDDETNKPLFGTWKYARIRDAEGWHEDFYLPDTSYTNFKCVDTTLTYCSEGDPEGCTSYISYIGELVIYDLEFSSKNVFKEIYVDKYKNIRLELSSCDNVVYTTGEDSGTEINGYSYDPATKLVTIVYDDNGGNNVYEMYATTLKVVELTATKLVFEDPENAVNQLELSKK